MQEILTNAATEIRKQMLTQGLKPAGSKLII
jgi:hypothetical protein